MGLLDIFKRSSAPTAKVSKGQKELARLTRVVSNKLSQDYDRQDAIRQLSAMGTSDSARALLRRFDFNMEPTITDHEEKESAAEGIVASGQDAIAPLRDYCARAESITWPLKVLKRVVSDEHLVDEMLTLLDQFDTEYVRNPEPKIQLISTLEEHVSEDVRLAVEPFLADVNENVRFTSVGTIFAMGSDDAVEPLVEALKEEESFRVKNRICGGLQKAGWRVPETLRDACAVALPPEFKLEPDGKLAR